MKIEHIGIAVKDLEGSNDLFRRLLGQAHYKQESVANENVTTSFFFEGKSKLELVAGIGGDAISKFIDKRGEGIHHIAFAVEDINAEMSRLKGEGFVLLDEEPRQGADNKLICFLHPKSTNGVLVELCQEISKKS